MQSNTRMTRWQRRLDRIFAVILVASLMLSSIAAAPAYQPVQAAAPEAQTDTARVNFRQIVMKFKADAGISVQSQGLVSASGADLANLQSAMQGLELRPVFTSLAETQNQGRISSQAASLPALNQYYYVQLPETATPAEAQALLEKLQADSTIETVYMEPLYLPASRQMITDDLTSEQGYLAAAPEGVDAAYAWDLTGGAGANVQIVDIEAGWQIGHEDLALKAADLIESGNSSDLNWVNHGTAVAGVMAAQRNGKGVTGIAYNAYVRMISTVNYQMADAILKAALNSRPGDIIVIPVQALGPISQTTAPDSCDTPNFESVPVENWPATYDAIYAATQLGIIVIEAGGTGAMDLDDDLYAQRFNRSYRDSGAILVGAGDSITRAPLCDANFGSRIDVQGWGNNVVTTGYGDRAGADPNEYYTATFGGSSAATSIVAGAAASLQGVARTRGYLLTPYQMRSILRNTGTAQTEEDRQIGPLPNLKKAIETYLSSGVELLSPPDYSTVRTLRPTLDWQDFLSATQYEIQVSTNSLFNPLTYDSFTSSSEFTVPANLRNNQPYFWRVRPFINEEWRGWSSRVFHFTTSIAAYNVPLPVTLTVPASSAVITNVEAFRPTFTWKVPTTIPDGYHIEISTAYDFSSGISEYVATNSFQPALPGLNRNSRYYWRVRSYYGTPPNDASFSAWTGRRVLYTAIEMPADIGLGVDPDGNEDTLRPTFEWSDITDARSYQWQISLVNTFKTLVQSATVGIPSGETIPPSKYVPVLDLPRTKNLFFRVRVRGTYGWSSWSNIGDLMTGNPPGRPSQIAPAQGAASNTWETGMLFTWSKPTTAPDTYQLQISTESDFDTLVIDESGIPNPDLSDPTTYPRVPNFTVTGLDPENKYYWRVRAIGDGTGLWSSVRIFYTTPPAPTGLGVVANDSLRPTLDWARVDIARSYQVQVALDNDATPDDEKYKLFTGSRLVANVTTQTSPPFMLTATLPRTKSTETKSFIWRVRAGGLWGYSNWSEISTGLTTPNPPNAPILSTPTNGANIGNFAPTLDWQDSPKITNNTDSDAVGYQLQVSNRSNFVIINVDEDILIDIDPADLVKSTYKLGIEDLPRAGTYYWRVRAVNGANEYSLWTSTWSFNTPAMVSGTVTDAMTGDPIQFANVVISGWPGLEATTDDEGNYTLRGLPPNDYTLLVNRTGYIRQGVRVGTGYGANRIRNVALAPIPEDGQLRFVLTWGGAPGDLDLHLWLPSTEQAHIHEDNLGDLGGFPYALMERTDSDAYGPEIITLSNTVAGKYRIAVYTREATDQLAGSRARVTVYDGATRLGEIVIPESGAGHWWRVLELDGTTRKITLTPNVITDSDPAPYRD